MPICADSVAPSVETPEHDAPIKYTLGTSVPPLAFKTMRAIAVRGTFYNVRFARRGGPLPLENDARRMNDGFGEAAPQRGHPVPRSALGRH